MLMSMAGFIGHWWYAEVALVIIIVGGYSAMRRSD